LITKDFYADRALDDTVGESQGCLTAQPASLGFDVTMTIVFQRTSAVRQELASVCDVQL
jgi:hypothetical protein